MKTTAITAKANGQGMTPALTNKSNGNNLQKNGDLSKDIVQVNGLPLAEDLAGGKLEKGTLKSQGSADNKEELGWQMARPALNLENTLKLVEELHRRKTQRDKLLSTIGTLEEFEVAQKNDAEETDSNHFQGCELLIEDDQRRQFRTKNPFIIKKVAEFVNTLCMDKLAEIEAEIHLPV
jgi:hypothetical protein